MKHLGTRTIETDRLILRRFTLEDADDMYRNWANDEEVTRYLTWPPHTSVEATGELLQGWIEAYQDIRNYNWCIEWKENHEAIGSISVVHLNDVIASVEIGYCIGHSYWRQGITSEALKALVKFFFGEVGVNRVEARHDVNNPGSGKVMLKCGLKYEGTRRKADKNNTGLCDMALYGMLAEDYNSIV